jgi:outer membrane protein assembly factor BamB
MEPNKPRLWPAYVVLGLQVVTIGLSVTPQINNLTRFLYMMAGPLVCLALFLTWLLFASRLRWQERLAVPFGAAILGLVAGQFAHQTMQVALWIYGVPVAMLLITLAETLLASRQSRSRLVATFSLVACGWAAFTAGRLEGFDGSYWPQFRWRWQPSPEQLLLERQVAEPSGDARVAIELSAADWPGFRGANRDGRIVNMTVQIDWNTSPPKELWRIPVGPAWSSFACGADRLFTQEQRGESEAVVCYHAGTGKEVWRQTVQTRFTEVVSGAGPRATPTIADGRLYTMGAKATLNCLDAATGEPIWSRDLVAEIGAKVPMWGFSCSPLVVDEHVIVYADGRDGQGLVAYDRRTGDPAWHVAAGGMNYTSAQPAAIAGVDLALFVNETGLLGIDPADGSVLWQFKPSGLKPFLMVQPQPISDHSVIMPLGDGIGVTRVDIQHDDAGWKVAERWTSRHLKPSFNDFVYHEGHLYGFDQNIFTCVDAETGKRKWKQGRYGFGQVLLMEASSSLIITCESGEVVHLAADPEEHRELGRIPALDGKTWNHPIVAANRLFLRNSEEAACYALPVVEDF